nr:hypothetical protein [Thermus scotoductus]
MRGAARSEGGKPIIALPSTAKGQSRIVPPWRKPPRRPRGRLPPSSPKAGWSGTPPLPTSWWGRWRCLGRGPPSS